MEILNVYGMEIKTNCSMKIPKFFFFHMQISKCLDMEIQVVSKHRIEVIRKYGSVVIGRYIVYLLFVFFGARANPPLIGFSFFFLS